MGKLCNAKDMQNLSDIFSTYKPIWQALSELWWLFLPVLLWYVFKFIWKEYVIEYSADSWLNNLEWTVLEIIPPKEVEKSPKVMESIYSGIAGVVAAISIFDEWLKGAFTDQFSLEIVGDEGTTHFYIRTQKKFRNLIEAQVYAQFPDAEIMEVPDYTARFPKTIPNKDWDLWGTDVEFKMPDPYPIRTYDKFEEDVTGTMIDPLAAMAEVIGKLGPGQHIWLQYIIQPLPEKWRDEFYQKLVDKLSKKAEKKEVAEKTPKIKEKIIIKKEAKIKKRTEKPKKIVKKKGLSALDVKKAVEKEENKRLAEEEKWDIPAFLRRSPWKEKIKIFEDKKEKNKQ